jgi:DNA polymerase III subunit beta
MIEVDTVTAQGTLKATCSRDDLLNALGLVSRGVSTRTSVQILAGILLEAGDGKLRLAATDMEVSLRTTIEAKIEAEGSVVVPGRLLLELARLLPEAEVVLEHKLEEGVCEISCGTATYRLHTYNAEDFPRLLETKGIELHEVDRQTMLETVARVSRSASRDESRPVLTGVLVHFEPGKLVMAATDSYRLSVKETALEGPIPELEAIVPARALAELARIAPEGEKLTLGVHENQVVFGTSDAWLTTRRIDGQFPNVQQLVPDTFEHEVSLPRDELLDVVRRVSVMAQRNSPLRLRFADGELTVSAQTQDVGEARESLPAAFSGDPLEIGFNAEFLRDGVEAIVGEQIRLKLISPLRPAVLVGESDDFLYLIMPIRLAG